MTSSPSTPRMEEPKISWVSAAEGSKWASLVEEITQEARALGPFREFAECPEKSDLR